MHGNETNRNTEAPGSVRVTLPLSLGSGRGRQTPWGTCHAQAEPSRLHVAQSSSYSLDGQTQAQDWGAGVAGAKLLSICSQRPQL